MPKKEKNLFLGKYTLPIAIGKTLDTEFQSSPEFQPLMAELYSHAFSTQNDLLFKFLENRFISNIIQDKEIIFNFAMVGDGN